MSRPCATGSPAIAATIRDCKILELRAEGLTIREVGRNVGVSDKTVHQVISKRLAAQNNQQAALYREALWLKYQAMERDLQEQAYGYRALLNDMGNPILEPVLNDDMTLKLDDDGKPIYRVRRDTGDNDRGKALLLKIWSDVTRLMGLAAPVRTETTIREAHADGTPEPVVFAVRDNGARHPLFARLTPAEMEDVIRYIVEKGFAQSHAEDPLTAQPSNVPQITYEQAPAAP